MTALETISDRVRSKDFAVQGDVARLGPNAVAGLAPLLHDADEEVRELAVLCLSALDSPAAASALEGGLADRDVQVAMAAAKGLRRIAAATHLEPILQAYDNQTDTQLKQAIALLIGARENPADIPQIEQRWTRTTRLEDQRGLTAALARLGDPDAKELFVTGLYESSQDERLHFLELAEFIGQAWLIPALGKLLDDATALLRVAVDGHPDPTEALRACDLAIILIAKISGVLFSFDATAYVNYEPAQIEEVRRFSRTQVAHHA